jgi:hypothetical protein
MHGLRNHPGYALPTPESFSLLILFLLTATFVCVTKVPSRLSQQLGSDLVGEATIGHCTLRCSEGARRACSRAYGEARVRQAGLYHATPRQCLGSRRILWEGVTCRQSRPGGSGRRHLHAGGGDPRASPGKRRSARISIQRCSSSARAPVTAMTTEQRPLRVDFERTLVRRRIPVECPKAVVYATSGSQSRGVSLPPKGYRKPPLTLRRQTDPLEVDLDRTRHAVESPWGIEPVLSLSALDFRVLRAAAGRRRGTRHPERGHLTRSYHHDADLARTTSGGCGRLRAVRIRVLNTARIPDTRDSGR